jgi:hypothetical protein
VRAACCSRVSKESNASEKAAGGGQLSRAKQNMKVQPNRQSGSTNISQQAFRLGQLAGHILTIQAFESSILARYPIATAVQP